MFPVLFWYLQTTNSTAPSPGCAHTQHLPVSQSSEGVQQKVGAAVSEQVLGVALLVVQRKQQHTGPPQLSCRDAPGSVREVGLVFSWQEQNLTILTQFLFIQWEGDKLFEPEGQLTEVLYALLLHFLNNGFIFARFKSCKKSEDSGTGPSDIVLGQGL